MDLKTQAVEMELSANNEVFNMHPHEAAEDFREAARLYELAGDSERAQECRRYAEAYEEL